jgi:signal transduction histidine kinase
MGEVEGAPAHGHHVQFYESSVRLARRVGTYLLTALDSGGAGIVVARTAHVAAISDELRARGLDLDDLVSCGRLRFVDADALMTKLVVEGRIDRSTFDASIAAHVRGALDRRLHVYGELVDLLWAAGYGLAVFELEALWAELLHEHSFSLLCGYRLDAFERDTEAFDLILACHDTVTGTHHVASFGADIDTARTLAAREEIISVVSHDLRNPLGAIMMSATTLLDVEVGDRTHRVPITADRIHRQAMRMARLIEDLVDFAGIQAGNLALEPGLHAAEAILTTTDEIFGPIARERGLRLATELRPGLPAICCDPDRAVLVLSSLVSNALKVTPRGGEIAIGAQRADNEVVFYVRDTGPGIEADALPSLFERHWRGSQSSYKGTGFGLAIARGIVDAHGGRIWAESRVGRGSVFYFSLSPQN